MKVVIIGGGEVGFHVAKALSEDDYDITVVDIDPIKCRRASENLDVIVVEGNGASPNTLTEARVGDADYVLSLTRVDEVNLIASQHRTPSFVPKSLESILLFILKKQPVMKS